MIFLQNFFTPFDKPEKQLKQPLKKYSQPFSTGGCYVECGMKKIAIFGT